MDYKNYTADNFIKDELFQRWVYTPDAQSDAYWIEVLSKYPHLNKPIEEARQFLQVFNFRENDTLDARISKLKKRIDTEIDATDTTPLKVQDAIPAQTALKKKFQLRAIYKIAASISIILIATYVAFDYRDLRLWLSGTNEQVTPKGNRAMINLEDGTRVWLNADSKLTYPESFAESTVRSVTLEGEAFFDVTENPAKPFVVNTAGMRVRVLGTSFNVRSYNYDQEVRTTLVKGKVMIESDDASGTLTLMPNQQAVFEKQTRKISLEHQVETEEFTSWREGKLSFDDQPLSIIIHELERWYNVTIKVEDQTALTCRFSAKINNKTLEEVMELFEASDGIHYTIEGKQVLIKGKLCNE
jgi:transmembrane sensor